MLMCVDCHTTEGPFICDTKIGRVLCEDCYMYNEVVDKCCQLIKTKSSVRNNLTMTAVTFMDKLSNSVFDKLEID